MEGQIVLLAEDNPDEEELILRSLRQARITNPVVVAHDGVETLDYLFARGQYAGRDVSDLPVVVFLDLKMPRINGLEVLQQIRTNEITRLVPVVILTSSGQEEDRLTSYRLGVNSFVRKPVVFGEFADTVKQLGNYWLSLNEPA